MKNWIKGILGDFITLQRGFDLPDYERHSGNVPVVTSSGISGFHNEAKVKAPGVVMGRYGTIGTIYFIEQDFWPHNTTLFVKDFKGNDPRFISYFLRTLDYQAHNDKSSVPGLNRNHLHLIPVILPPLSEQRDIAAILSSLDDKIELNRRMNQTLESMARTLFKSWFVDFDPVRAKAEGRDTGLPAEIADLFPASFEESRMGEIPSGWKVTSFGNVVNNFDSKRIPLSGREREQRRGIYPYYGAASAMDFVDDFIFDGVYVLLGEDGSVVDENDHPVVQYTWGKFWVNNHAHVLQGKDGISTEQIMLFLKEVNIRPYVTGAVQPKVNQANMNSIPFLMPDPKICIAFYDLVNNFYKKIRHNIEEQGTLTSIRDEILPKLLSGELSVC